MSGCFTKTLIPSEVPLVLKQMIYQMKAYIFLDLYLNNIRYISGFLYRSSFVCDIVNIIIKV